MKRCLGCNANFNKFEWCCPKCGFSPQRQEGFICFSPDLAKDNEGFEEEYFKKLFTLEDQNFWFTSRNHLIVWAIKKCFPQARNLLEIGCGTGYVLSGIQKNYPDLTLNGSEIFLNGLGCASQRLHNVELFQMDARNIPFDSEFDIIGAFDVIEHIIEDELVLSEIFRSLKHNGGLLITVPQHPFLWSSTDDLACHVRRYTAEELKAKVERAGFKVERITSFVSLLFPLLFISRLRNKMQKGEPDPFGELKINPILNKSLKGVLSLERYFIKAGTSFPFGGSLLLVGRKA